MTCQLPLRRVPIRPLQVNVRETGWAIEKRIVPAYLPVGHPAAFGTLELSHSMAGSYVRNTQLSPAPIETIDRLLLWTFCLGCACKPRQKCPPAFSGGLRRESVCGRARSAGAEQKPSARSL
jgi:hypothetical protein